MKIMRHQEKDKIAKEIALYTLQIKIQSPPLQEIPVLEVMTQKAWEITFMTRLLS